MASEHPSSSAPTISDVAAEAGVGRATAARTLGGYGSVSAVARERVLAAAERLGYRSNILARSMTTGVTNSLGIVVADIGNTFFSGLIRGASDAASARNLDVIVISTYEDLAAERHAVGVLLDKQVDGIVVSSAAVGAPEAEHLTEATRRGTPVVLIDRLIPGLHLDAVVVDNRAEARRVTRTLIEAGHRRIGFLWGPTTDAAIDTLDGLLTVNTRSLWSDAERLRGYLDALQDAGIPYSPALVSTGAKTEESAAEAASVMLRSADPPTAIFATEAEALIGALHAVQDLGLSYPGDVSLVGFDDTSWATVMQPPLTMIAQPVDEMGRLAVEQVVSRIGAPEYEPRLHMLPAELMLRSSIGPAQAIPVVPAQAIPAGQAQASPAGQA
ncbi:LacI family DNA-binding transcriptional regulator [Arthrobacter sp. TmT3-37]